MGRGCRRLVENKQLQPGGVVLDLGSEDIESLRPDAAGSTASGDYPIGAR